MTLSNGVYRGWRIALGIVPETSGQMFVEMEIVDPDTSRLAAFRAADDGVIRDIFNFPKENIGDFGFFRNEENNGFQYTFMFNVLPGHATLYSYLAYIFKCIDSLVVYIEEVKKTSEEKILKGPPMQAAAHTVIFPKGTVVSTAIIEGKEPQLLIQNVDGKNEHIFFKLSESLIDKFGDKMPEYLQKKDEWYDVVKDIYVDEFDGEVTYIDITSFFIEKLKPVQPARPVRG